MTPAIVPADAAWMLMSTALVLLMTPAAGFFYGGLVRATNALNTMVFALPVEEVHRIRTGDRDETAVTPAAV